MRGTTGISLIELIVVLALTAIISTYSIHYSTCFFQQYRIHQATNSLQHTLQFAKLAAVSQHSKVSICPAPWKNNSCGNDWNQGISIILASPTPKLLKELPPFKIQGKIVWQGWLKHPYPSFEADGMPHSYHGSFWWCGAENSHPLIVINQSARIRVADNNLDDESLKNPCGA